jgi:hypothetical protein
MIQLTEEQEYLLLGKIGGVLSPEEEREWDELVQTNPSAQVAYANLIDELPPGEVADNFQRVKQDETWIDITARYKGEKAIPAGARRITMYIRTAVACVLLFFTAGIWLYYQSHHHFSDGGTAGAEDHSRKPGIRLTLAGGKEIDLSGEKASIPTKIANLTSKNGVLTWSIGPKTSGTLPEGVNRLTVPIGIDYKVDLDDGSEIWLNSATTLDFPFAFSGTSREVSINGEAYLKIAKDPSRPFIVHLPGSNVEVLGTEFNVNTYDSGIVKVALVTGAVDLRSAGESSRVTPGREAVYHFGQPIRQEPFDPGKVLGWREGLFYFNGATLSEINKVVPRWFGIVTVLDDPAIRNRQFVGAVDRHQPIQVFLDNLKAIARIDSYFDKDSVLHFK